jgi:hypothetical protein
VEISLWPQLSLLHGSEVVLDESHVVVCHCAIARQPWGATSLGLVGEVNGVSLVEKIRCPPLTAIRCVEPILDRQSASTRVELFGGFEYRCRLRGPSDEE